MLNGLGPCLASTMYCYESLFLVRSAGAHRVVRVRLSCLVPQPDRHTRTWSETPTARRQAEKAILSSLSAYSPSLIAQPTLPKHSPPTIATPPTPTLHFCTYIKPFAWQIAPDIRPYSSTK
uniref:Uncharacterized protein n=1 Tax=Plectus sambesii TaxID=2011161 RepID=A0A914XB61_9BILA